MPNCNHKRLRAGQPTPLSMTTIRVVYGWGGEGWGSGGASHPRLDITRAFSSRIIYHVGPNHRWHFQIRALSGPACTFRGACKYATKLDNTKFVRGKYWVHITEIYIFYSLCRLKIIIIKCKYGGCASGVRLTTVVRDCQTTIEDMDVDDDIPYGTFSLWPACDAHCL